MKLKSDEFYFELAAEQARLASCTHAHCGAVVVAKNGKVIGKGFNAPPLNSEKARMCNKIFDYTMKPKYDKTCCVHAEWNAILDALKNFGRKIDGGTLYFMRVDENGNWTDAGKPFCTVCSRLALQSGLKNFALWVDDKPKIYDTIDYNSASYDYYKK